MSASPKHRRVWLARDLFGGGANPDDATLLGLEVRT
jgi:hypothetical protein